MKFLFKPKPFNDESLLSYLSRHSKANLYSLNWLKDKIKLSNISNYNINYSIKDKTIDKIIKFINLTSEQINEMTYEKYKFIKNGFLSHDCKMDMVKMNYSRFCPICLNNQHYHSLYWDLTPIKICLKHHIFLLDNCIKCNKPISIIDITNNKCNCGNQLTDYNQNIIVENDILYQQLEMSKKMGIEVKNNIVCVENNNINKQYINGFFGLVDYIRNNEFKFNYENTELFKNSKKRLNNRNSVFRLLKETVLFKRSVEDLTIMVTLHKIKNYNYECLILFLENINFNCVSIFFGYIKWYVIKYLEDYFQNNNYLYTTFNKYIKKTSTYSNFIDNIKYISSCDLAKYFGINRAIIDVNGSVYYYVYVNDIKKYFGLSYNTIETKFVSRRSVRLEEIIDYLFSIINRYSLKYISDNSYYTTINEILMRIDRLGFSQLDIINLINNENIDVVLCPFIKNENPLYYL